MQVKVKGRWIDVARTLITEGHAIWLPNAREYAWNKEYSVLAGRAARAQLNLWDPDYCGVGPNEGQPLNVWVNWDADGNDDLDPNGEWVRIKNPDPVNALPLGGWWLRDSALRRYKFPSWAEVPPGGEITVYDGIGDDNEDGVLLGAPPAGVRERHARREVDGRRRLHLRPAGRPAVLDDLPVPRGVRRPAARLGEDHPDLQGPRGGADHQRDAARRSTSSPTG